MKKNNSKYLHEARKFYYDFQKEKKIGSWRFLKKEGDLYTFGTSLRCNAPRDAVILFDAQRTYDRNRFLSLSLQVDDNYYAPEESETSYISFRFGIRYAFRCHLEKGVRKLFVTVKCAEEVGVEKIVANWIPDLDEPEKRFPRKDERLFKICKETYPSSTRLTIPADYTPGTGRKVTPGHFGFTKGDGLLDCSMPVLGVVDKLFMSGDPRYTKPYKWTLSLLPRGLKKSQMFHGSYPPAFTGVEKDRIQVNHLSVHWSSLFACEDGSVTDYSCRYSMATPLIMVKSDRKEMCLSMLEYAGNYHYLMYAGEKGIAVRDLLEGEFAGPDMKENWMLLFGTDEFPDVPILLVFTAPVSHYSVTCRKGRLAEILFSGPDKMFYGTPFGIETLYPTSPDNAIFMQDAVSRARFWSRAALAFPIHCKEYFKNDPAGEKVHIYQEFEYEMTRDAWGTEPLKLAPFPTVTSLAGTADFPEAPVDYRFPTKFGYLKGAVNTHISSFEIPFMPRGRRYPLPEEGDGIKEHLKKGLEEYFAFQEKFPPEITAYIFAGSILEPYAWTSSMFLFMEEAEKKRLRDHLLQRLDAACDPDFVSRYPIITWGRMMRECPERDRLVEMIFAPDQPFIRRYNSYSRKEPFTGEKITYNYINACYYTDKWFVTGERDEVEKFPFHMIENDWGVGITLYYTYLSALAAGDFSAVKRFWPHIKEIWGFYDLLCDWSLMGSAYSDNGLTWVEGGNYGGFTGFVNLAEAVGEKEDMEYGIYLAAKQFVLRLALLKAGQHYFHKYFGVPPYGLIWGFFEEKWSGHLFQFVPTLTPRRYQPGSLGTITTEGMYPETFEALMQFAPEEMRQLRNNSYAVLRDPEAELHEYSINQSSACLLQSALLDENYPIEQAAEELARGEERDEIIRQWRGIHVFSRNLPENYFSSQLRAYLQGRSQPMHLEHWSGLQLEWAEYKRKENTVLAGIRLNGELPGFLRIRVKSSPRKITQDGKELPFQLENQNKVELSLPSSGVLIIEFE